MSVSSEVRRTLVKSPPELWAELSDPATLGRHLGELGEIRITGTDPERLVDWEATGTDGTGVSGRVEIEPSGWGTRVTLSASRAVVEPELETEFAEQAPEPAPGERNPEDEVVTVQAIEPEQAPEPEAEPVPQSIEVVSVVETEPEPEIVEPEPRPGFFARLFRRRRQQPAAELEPDQVAEPEPVAESELAPEPIAKPEPSAAEPVATVEVEESPTEAIAEIPAREEPTPEEPAPEGVISATDIAAELTALEEQTTAVLTGVLDRLGAAHHRPFSRA